MNGHVHDVPYEALERARRGAVVPAPPACLCGPPWASLVSPAGITEEGLDLLATREMPESELELLAAIGRAAGQRRAKPHERAPLREMARWGLIADSNAARVTLTTWGERVLRYHKQGGRNP